MPKKRGTKVAEQAAPEEARIEYARLTDIVKAKRNPKRHDLPGIIASIRRHGFVMPLLENTKTGRIVAGHGRDEALEAMFAEDPKNPPARIKVDADGMWMVPIIRGVSFPSEQRAEEYLIGDNRWVEAGGWNWPEMVPIFEDIAKRGADAVAALGFSVEDMGKVIARIAAASTAPVEFQEISAGNVTVQYCCPKCAYVWSGSPDPAKKIVKTA